MTRNIKSRLTVEKLGDDAIDVRELYRAGLLKGPWVTVRPSFRWPGIVQIRAARYLVQLELCNQVVPQQIRVSWTGCHFGGARPWLQCPFCKRRVAKLYRGLGGYCCRPCIGNPPYTSQTKSTQGRRHFEACKLRLSLNGNASLTQPFPERPRRMHRTTYARILSRAEALEADLSPRMRKRAVDYQNLVYYMPR